MKSGFWYTFLAIALGLFLGACKQGSDIVPATQSAYLDVINATNATFNVYLNGARLNSTSNITASGSSGYLTVPALKETYSVEHPIDVNAMPISTPKVDFTKSLELAPKKYYSLFVTGSTAESAFLINETKQTASGDTAKVRFVHAAPDLGTLNVTINGATNFTGANYQSASAFVPFILTSGSQTSVINIYSSTNNAAPIATFTLSLSQNNIYTIFIKDVKNDTSITASAGYVLNN